MNARLGLSLHGASSKDGKGGDEKVFHGKSWSEGLEEQLP